MMNKPLEIYIPCEVFEVEVQLGSDLALSGLEKHVLSFLANLGNAIHFDILADLFGIGYRPMLTVIESLWYRGRVHLDLETGRVHLVEESRIDENDLRSDPGETMTLSLMQELVTGHILRLEPGRNRFGPQHVCPQQLIEATYHQANSAQLSRVVRELLKKKLKERKSLNTLDPKDETEIEGDGLPFSAPDLEIQVLNASIRVDKLARSQTTGQRRDWEIHIASHVSSEGRDFIRIVHPPLLDPLVRHDLERGLARLMEEYPDDPCIRLLRGQPNDYEPNADATELSPRIALEALAGEIDGCSWNCEEVRILERDRKWRAQGTDLWETLNIRRSLYVRQDVVLDNERLGKAVKNCLVQAQEQIVLVWPDLTWSALRPLFRDLSNALQRNVHVYLIWGRHFGDTVDSHLVGALQSWRNEYPKQFHLSNRAAQTNEWILIQDDQEVIVAQRWEFRASTEVVRHATVEHIAAVVTQPSAGKATNWLAGYFLSRLQKHYPDWNEGRSFRFVGVQIAEEVDVPEPKEAPLPSAGLANAIGGRNTGMATMGREAWLAGWQTFVADAREQAGKQSDWLEPVIDGEHHTWIADAIKNAKRRLLILSDGISVRVLTDSVVARILEAVARGITITIGYSRRVETASDALEARLSALGINAPNMLIKQIPCVGGLLLWDDRVLITGMPLLATTVRHAVGEGFISRKSRSPREAGIVLENPMMADRVWERLCGHSPTNNIERAVSAISQSATESPESHSATLAVQRGLPLHRLMRVQDLVQRFNTLAETGESVRWDRKMALFEDWFKVAWSEHELWDDLLYLESRLGNDEDFSKIVATALATHCRMNEGQQTASREDRKWRAWLADYLWRGGNWVQAAVLVESLAPRESNHEFLPSARLAWAAVAMDSDAALGELLADTLAENNLSTAEAQGFTLLAMLAVLRSDLHAFVAWLDPEPDIRSRCLWGDAWWQWASALRDFRYMSNVAVPFGRDRVCALPDVRDRQRAVEEHSQQLRDAFNKLASARFAPSFKGGILTWERLLDGRGPFGILEQLIGTKNEAGIHHWVEQHTPWDAGTLLDKTGKDLLSDGKLTRAFRFEEQGGRRTLAIKRLTDVYNAAAAYQEANIALALTQKADDRNLRRLAEAWRQVSSALEEETNAMARDRRPEAVLGRRLLWILEPWRQ